MSLLLAVTQKTISKICVPKKVAETMLPCSKAANPASFKDMEIYEHFIVGFLENVQLLVNDSKHRNIYRQLADDADDNNIPKSTNATDSCTNAHLSSRYNNFNFQKYIERSLEEDFKVVVSVRF
ncbi:MLO-like protein 3 [Forsythia ovata]|uniref:MLO-like protein 3 n=1 Tax=Forsythia ovata TaxID=205694 RepID=A0ABD1SPY5_9LAMI